MQDHKISFLEAAKITVIGCSVSGCTHR